MITKEKINRFIWFCVGIVISLSALYVIKYWIFAE